MNFMSTKVNEVKCSQLAAEANANQLIHVK